MFQNKNTHKRLAMTLGGIIGVMSIGTIITIATLDTTQEIPDGEVGTIGYALKKIIGVNWQSDVNVLQSRQLGGVNGEKYLRLTGALPLGCSQADQVLQGFDMDGTNPKCVTVPTTKRPRPILATLRDLDSSCYGGKIKISNPGYSSGGTTIPPRTINPSSSDPIDLYEDDAIETTAGCSLASLYMPDNSIIRLSASTKITLRYAGIPGGSGATSTDLNSGEMWARVLKPITDDSYFNINTQEASVGVRGTSVWISRDSTNKKTTTLPIDSGKLTATDIASNSGAIVVYPKHGDLTALGTPVPLTHTITVDLDGKSQLAPYRTSTTTQIYKDKPFVRIATLADIKDFKALEQGVGNLATIQATKSKLTGNLKDRYSPQNVLDYSDRVFAPAAGSVIHTEITRTLPSNNNERSALCLSFDGDNAGTATPSSSKQWWDAVPLGRTNCIDIGTGFLADYSKNDESLYGVNLPSGISRGGLPNADNGGILINANNQYIQYSTIPPNLKNRQVTLNLGESVGHELTGKTKYYIADFGSNQQWFIVTNGGKCRNVTYNSNTLCKKINNIENVIGPIDTMKSVTFTIEEEPTQLIFGNWHRILPADDYPNPIGTTIQSISIKIP